jgi:hypothetical protein
MMYNGEKRFLLQLRCRFHVTSITPVTNMQRAGIQRKVLPAPVRMVSTAMAFNVMVSAPMKTKARTQSIFIHLIISCRYR